MYRNLLLIAAAVLLSGCACFTRTVYVAERQPLIPVVARPQLTEGSDAANATAVMQYARTLENVIKAYNLQVREHNTANGYPETDLTK